MVHVGEYSGYLIEWLSYVRNLPADTLHRMRNSGTQYDEGMVVESL